MADQFSGAGGIYPAGSFYAGLADRLTTLEDTVGTSLGAVSAAEQAQAAANAANAAATNAQQTLDTVIANTANIAAEAAEAAEALVNAAAAEALADAQAAALAAEAAAQAAGMFDPAIKVDKSANLSDLTDKVQARAHLLIWTGSQAAYDAITTKNNDTLYHIY